MGKARGGESKRSHRNTPNMNKTKKTAFGHIAPRRSYFTSNSRLMNSQKSRKGCRFAQQRENYTIHYGAITIFPMVETTTDQAPSTILLDSKGRADILFTFFHPVKAIVPIP